MPSSVSFYAGLCLLYLELIGDAKLAWSVGLNYAYLMSFPLVNGTRA